MTFTSDSPDADVKLLRDINLCLENMEYVILTSKVTTGCDHSNEQGKFFIDAGGHGRGCTPRNLLQQLGRFRKLSDTNVCVLVSQNEDNRTGDISEAYLKVMDDLKQHRHLYQTKYANLLKYDVENVNEKLVLSPDQVSTLFAYNIAEQRVQFISTLATQAENKGFRVTLRDSLISKSELCATADKKVSMKEDSLEEEI